MVCRDRGLHYGKSLDFARLRHLKDCTGTVAYKHHTIFVKRNAGSDAEPGRVSCYLFAAINAAHLAVGTVRDIHLAIRVKCYTRRVEDLGRHFIQKTVRLQPVKGKRK